MTIPMKKQLSEVEQALGIKDIKTKLIIVDEKGAGYASCDTWHVAYQLREECEKAHPLKRFSIRHADLEHPKCHVHFRTKWVLDEQSSPGQLAHPLAVTCAVDATSIESTVSAVRVERGKQ